MCPMDDHSPYGPNEQSSFEVQAAGEWDGTHRVQSNKMLSSMHPRHAVHEIDGIQEMDQDEDLAKPHWEGLSSHYKNGKQWRVCSHGGAGWVVKAGSNNPPLCGAICSPRWGIAIFSPVSPKKQSNSRSNEGVIFFKSIPNSEQSTWRMLVPRAVPWGATSFLQHVACLLPVASILPFAQADGPWLGQVQPSLRALAGSGHPTSLSKRHKSLFFCLFFTGGN